MMKYFAAVLLLASLAFGQEGYILLVEESIGNVSMGYPVGCVETFGETVFISYNDSKVNVYSSCTEQNEENLLESSPCEAPKCKFVTELPSGLLKFAFGGSCESLAKTVFVLIKDSECFTMGESISFIFEDGSDSKNITGASYENSECSGDPFQTYNFISGECQQIEPEEGMEPVYVMLERSSGIQTIVSMALLITMLIALF